MIEKKESNSFVRLPFPFGGNIEISGLSSGSKMRWFIVCFWASFWLLIVSYVYLFLAPEIVAKFFTALFFLYMKYKIS